MRLDVLDLEGDRRRRRGHVRPLVPGPKSRAPDPARVQEGHAARVHHGRFSQDLRVKGECACESSVPTPTQETRLISMAVLTSARTAFSMSASLSST
jgi:hypothetical protein